MKALEERLEILGQRGVVIVDSRQTHVDEAVDLERLRPGCVLHPGTRLSGRRTFLGAGAQVGHEGPVVLHDTVLDQDARIASGYARGAVLLRGASAGANAHLREGTLMEEESSTAHCVGLKQTILLSFVTLGSLVNCCDVLVAGGTSRADHSEIGSGFIHFNFTPWGRRGDKATPSCFGDVVRGVFLRQPRIFVGGMAGVVGPRSIGFGSVTGAGQVLRRDVPDGRLSVQASRPIDRPWVPHAVSDPAPRLAGNVEFIAQMVALSAWYRHVRLPRSLRGPEGPGGASVVEEAVTNVDAGIQERLKRLASFLEERNITAPKLELPPIDACPLTLDEGPREHVDWVQGLSERTVQDGIHWLNGVADGVRRWGDTIDAL